MEYWLNEKGGILVEREGWNIGWKRRVDYWLEEKGGILVEREGWNIG